MKYNDYTNQLTEEESILYEKYQLTYEQLLHHMFCNPAWAETYPHRNKKRLRVLAYCMYFYGITTSQLLSTGITPLSNEAAERMFLSRLKNAGLLRSSVYSQPSGYITVFFLTAKGADICKEGLLEMLRESGSPVDPECIEYIYRRFKKFTDVVSLGHFLGIRDLGTYLLSSFSNVPFSYRLECGIYFGGGRVSIAESLRGGLFGFKRKQIAMICDALLGYPASMPAPQADRSKSMAPRDRQLSPADSAFAPLSPLDSRKGILNPSVSGTAAPFPYSSISPAVSLFMDGSPHMCHVYVEQDMSTQRRNVIVSKLANYVQNVAVCAPFPALETVLFSILTPNTDLREAGIYRERENRNASRYATLSSVPIVAYLLYHDDWKDTPVADLADVYEQIVGNVTCLDQKYRNTLSCLREMSDGSPGLTIGSVFDSLGESERVSKEEREKLYDAYHRKRYLLRKETLRGAVHKVSDLSEMFLRGFSVCVSHNRAHKDILPFLFPFASSGMADCIKALSNLYFGTDFARYGRYESFRSGSSTGSFVLRNHYYWEDGTHLYIENVSDDYGGLCRVKHYLASVEWDGEEGYLICLVADDDTASLKDLSSFAYYTVSDDERMVLPLQVYFITYSNLLQSRGLSYYDPATGEFGQLSSYLFRSGQQ